MKIKLSLINLLMAVTIVMAPVAVLAEEPAKGTESVAAETTLAPAPAPSASAAAPEAAASAAAAPAEAATPKPVDPVLNTGDTAWMLISAALVLFMIPGLAFFYGGMVRSKNVLSTSCIPLSPWVLSPCSGRS